MIAKLLLTSATAAAALVSTLPSHHASAQPLVNAGGSKLELVVPATAKTLAATLTGSPALAAHARMTIVRTNDDATLFTGSLATFHALQVQPGAHLRVEVDRASLAGLTASAMLSWS
ncbi:MAG TPA: hypothetical protein VI408_08930 [Gaiellaceae bacterium]